jgi:hypothetical protein
VVLSISQQTLVVLAADPTVGIGELEPGIDS